MSYMGQYLTGRNPHILYYSIVIFLASDLLKQLIRTCCAINNYKGVMARKFWEIRGIMRTPVGIDKTLDGRGLKSQRLTILTNNTLKNMEKGQVLMAISDDRAARESLPFLCSVNGYRLLEMEEEKGIIYFTIQR